MTVLDIYCTCTCIHAAVSKRVTKACYVAVWFIKHAMLSINTHLGSKTGRVVLGLFGGTVTGSRAAAQE